jgi:DNA-binding MarR family transcriptional regulator
VGKIDVAKVWGLDYRLIMSVIASVTPAVGELGLEIKELFVLAEIDAFAHPAALADRLCMPKPTITVYLKRLEAAGLVRREIDVADLRRHHLTLTPAGRKVMTRGLALLAAAFDERFGRLAAAEQAELKRLLEKMS